MRCTDMQLQVTPAVSYIITVRVGAVEAKKDKGLFHHLLRFKKYGEFGVFETNRFRGIGGI